MKRIRQLLLSLLLMISIFPSEKISAVSMKENNKNINDKIAESSHPELPEGVTLEKHVEDIIGTKLDLFLYEFNKLSSEDKLDTIVVKYVIELTNNSGEKIDKVFLQDDFSDLDEYLVEGSMASKLALQTRNAQVYSEEKTNVDTVEDLADGVYIDLKEEDGSFARFEFELELKQELSKEEFKTLKNTVIANNLKEIHEIPVVHANVVVDKQGIAYLGETPFDEDPGYGGDDLEPEEPGEDEEPPEDQGFSMFRLFTQELDGEIEILEYAEAGAKIRYAIVVDNIGGASTTDYTISDVSLKDIVPQYAQYVYEDVSVYSGFDYSESFVLKENPSLEGYDIVDKIKVQELEENYDVLLYPGERNIFVFDLILNEELPEDLEYIENIVEHSGGKVTERIPFKPKETEQPETPDEEEKPEVPVEDEKPEVPGENEKPEVPGENEKPEVPGEDEKPEVPSEDGKPETPGNPEQPVVEEPEKEKLESVKKEDKLPATGMGSLSHVSLRMILIGFIMILIGKSKD